MKQVTLLIFMMLALPAIAFAASKKAAPGLKAESEVNGAISNKVINDVYESCKYHIPARFTPEAREYYCSCNAANLQGNFRIDEYNELQKAANRKPGNKTFEKYIHTSVAPCLDMPVQQIEYLYCLLDTSDDIRIGNVPGYCQCVSKKMRKHAEKFAEVELMTKLAEDPNTFKDPVDALWNNQTYLSTKFKSRDDCIIEGH